MPSSLYDDNYVDTVAVLSAAKTAGLDMEDVGSRMDAAGLDSDELFAWSEWVYAEIRKENPDFVDYSSLRKRLIGLDAWTNDLSEGLQAALDGDGLKEWEPSALEALEEAKKTARELYG